MRSDYAEELKQFAWLANSFAEVEDYIYANAPQSLACGHDDVSTSQVLQDVRDILIKRGFIMNELTTALDGRTQTIVETPSIASCEVFIPYSRVGNDRDHKIVELEKVKEEKQVGRFSPCGLSWPVEEMYPALIPSELPAYYQLTDDKYTVHKWCEREGKHVVIASVAPEYIGVACWLVDLFNSKKINSPSDSVTTCNELFKSMDRDAVDNKPFGTKLWEENSVSCPDKLSPTIINQGLCAPYEARG